MKPIMTEREMQQYANENEGYEVEFLFEYATDLGFEATIVINEKGKESYLFSQKEMKDHHTGVLLRTIGKREVKDPEFETMFHEEKLYEIILHEEVVGYLSLLPYKDGMLISNILISHMEQGKGYGMKCIQTLKKLYPILYGHPVEESMGFWKKTGAVFENDEYYVIKK